MTRTTVAQQVASRAAQGFTRTVVRSAVALSVLIAGAAQANSAQAAPAWQTPGYVMEEVVATAPAPLDASLPAWQTTGYVMEEVVATAPVPTSTSARAAAFESRGNMALALWRAHRARHYLRIHAARLPMLQGI